MKSGHMAKKARKSVVSMTQSSINLGGEVVLYEAPDGRFG